MKPKARNIGVPGTGPQEEPDLKDKKDPYYGNIALRGRTITGTLVKSDIHNSGTVEISRRRYVPKFERYAVRRTRIRVHNPASVNASIGDKVMCMETRPMSKTKKFVIIKKFGQDIKFVEKTESAAIDKEMHHKETKKAVAEKEPEVEE